MNLRDRSTIQALPGGEELWRALDQLAGAMPEVLAGTWTASDDSGAGLALIPHFAGSYIRQGRIVTAVVGLIWPTTASTAFARVGSLPCKCDTRNNHSVIIYVTTSGLTFTGTVLAGTAAIAFFKTDGTGITNADLSGKHVGLTAVYFTA